MLAHKLAFGGVVAGLTLGVVSVAFGDHPIPIDTDTLPSVQGVAELDPIQGLLPLDVVVERWQQRADARPLDYLSRTQLGVALAGQARENADLAGYERSEDALREALEINPSFQASRLALASTLIAQHEFAEARELAAMVIDADPSALGALALAGDASLELGDHDEATAAYQRLTLAERSAPVVSRLARLASVNGDNDGAVALAEEALALSEKLAIRPDGAAFYWFQLGHFRFASGDVAGSIEALQRALEISPSNPAANEQLAFVFAASGEIDAALDLYQALVERVPAADIHGLYADLLRRAGDLDGAAEQDRLGLELAMVTIDRFPSERRHMAGFFVTRDPEVALELAEADLATRNDWGAYDTLAWALHHNGLHDQAAEAIEAALADGTRDARMLYHAAAIAAASGDRGLARERLAEALAINPQFHPTEGADAAALVTELDGSRLRSVS